MLNLFTMPKIGGHYRAEQAGEHIATGMVVRFEWAKAGRDQDIFAILRDTDAANWHVRVNGRGVKFLRRPSPVTVPPGETTIPETLEDADV